MFCTHFINSSFSPPAAMCDRIVELVQGQPYALSKEQIAQFFQKAFLDSTLTVLFTSRTQASSGINCEVPAAVAFWRLVLDEAELDYMVVFAAFRGAGLGRELLSTSERFFLQRGIVRGSLEVSEKNLSARKVYEQFGYAPVGSRARYYRNGETALVMAKLF